MKAWRIDPDNTFSQIEIDDTLDAMQSIVDGNIELVPLNKEPKAAAFCNEEGKLRQLPVNFAATVFCARNGRHSPLDPIVGSLLIVGITSDGGATDAPDWIEEDIARIAQPVEL